MASLHESIDFATSSPLEEMREDVFRHCAFDALDVEGSGFEGIAVDCTFKNSAWYWSLFVMARFVEVEFRGCVFRGCSFADCVFVRCKFLDCQFIKDNLDGDCRFSDCAWYDCRQIGCEGLPQAFVPLQ